MQLDAPPTRGLTVNQTLDHDCNCNNNDNDNVIIAGSQTQPQTLAKRRRRCRRNGRKYMIKMLAWPMVSFGSVFIVLQIRHHNGGLVLWAAKRFDMLVGSVTSRAGMCPNIGPLRAQLLSSLSSSFHITKCWS
ncbi:hypothetical protein ACH5RR_001688 [Cinchona calisaya]|uniref:Transmembrane protein n=1 Tax=Cinchona calisaya TaxID=153742 RepID=A0ABD3B441_9GENT